jgi:hypothetical protein
LFLSKLSDLILLEDLLNHLFLDMEVGSPETDNRLREVDPFELSRASEDTQGANDMETARSCCCSPVFLVNGQSVSPKLFGQSDRGGFARVESGVVRNRGRKVL